MNDRDFNGLKLLAEGGQSKIYQYDSACILRVPKFERDFERIRYEFCVYKMIENRISSPFCHELLVYGDRPCLLMDKIEGPTLLEHAEKNPLALLSLPDTLAKLHTKIFCVTNCDTLTSNHAKAAYCIDKSELLPPAIKDKLMRLLPTLATGKNLCHGDFHPGNIILSEKEKYIIDWSSASQGSPLFDIAHTYLLLVNTPKLDNMSDREYNVQAGVAKHLGKKYLKKVCRLNALAPDAIGPYMLIKAAERTYYGINNEKIWLLDFIKANIDRKAFDVLHKYKEKSAYEKN